MATLALYGSGEFLPWTREVDRWCLDHATVSSDKVLILPAAAAPEGDQVFRRWAAMGLEHYEAQDLSPEVVELRTREDAHRSDLREQLTNARLIFFSGGNPGYLAEILSDTPFWRAVLDAVASGAALAGCSAGACIVGTLVPFVEGEGVARWVDGLKVLEAAYVAPHFDALESYQPGMRARVIAKRPEGSTVVGIDEDTAFCGDGERWRVFGSGAVWTGASADALLEHRPGDEVVVPLGPTVP